MNGLQKKDIVLAAYQDKRTVFRLKDIYSDVELATLLDRNVLTNRDIFDCWFFMQKRTPINTELVEARMRMPYADYIERCICYSRTYCPGSLIFC